MRFAMLNEKIKLFKALSDPNRLRILKMLQYKPLCVCEVTSLLNLATSTVSKHLHILKEAGFIIEKKDGKWVYYFINNNPDDKRVTRILMELDFWISDNQQIVSDLRKIEDLDNQLACTP